MANETSPNELVGRVAGGYRIVANIGSGTMGHVYEAEDVNVGKHVALKVLHKSHQKELAPRFLREGKTLALLSHPNIVQLVDMGQLEDGTLFLATELVAGMSLREPMNQGALEPQRALTIMRQVLDALDAAHGLGVVHRDIKPENIMLEGNDYVKVLDFGVAKLLSDTVAGLGEANLTSVGFSIFGSALYIAPESVVGAPVDARLDLYSAGAVLYEMLTGKPPFDHEDPAVLLRMQAFDPPPTLQQGAPALRFTPEIEALVACALAKQPDDRYRSAAHMIVALDAALESMRPAKQQVARPPTGPAPVIFDRPPTTPVVRRSAVSRKHKMLIAGAGAITILGLVTMMLAFAGRDNKEDTDELAGRAKALLATGKSQETIDLVERELAGPTKPSHGKSYLVLGHARFALGRRLQAIGAYERALRVMPELGADPELRTNLSKTIEGKDDLAVVLALDLLSLLSPPAHDAIVSYASTGKLEDARRRAVMIAEREGLADRIDRIESWTLDLQQASTCEERKLLIEKLAATADRRALTGLKKVRTVKCVEREATDAIARIEGPTTPPPVPGAVPAPAP